MTVNSPSAEAKHALEHLSCRIAERDPDRLLPDTYIMLAARHRPGANLYGTARLQRHARRERTQRRYSRLLWHSQRPTLPARVSQKRNYIKNHPGGKKNFS